MRLSVKEVLIKKELKQFIYLPAKIYKNNPIWVPPIYSDEWKYFNKRKYKPYKYCDTILFLAFREAITNLLSSEYETSVKLSNFRLICFLELRIEILLGSSKAISLNSELKQKFCALYLLVNPFFVSKTKTSLFSIAAYKNSLFLSNSSFIFGLLLAS